jgi:uncharacterized surface protein with fasciclin (FAS1) repeats
VVQEPDEGEAGESAADTAPTMEDAAPDAAEPGPPPTPATDETAEATDEAAEATDEPAKDEQDILSTLQAKGQFATLVKAAEAAEVLPELDNPGPLTVFAPTDDAFGKLKAGLLEQLLEAKESLRYVLQYHALTEELSSAAALERGTAPTVAGPDLTFKQEGDQVLVNEAVVVTPDVKCTNGVVHIIDGVLIPPDFKLPTADASEGEAETTSPPAAAEQQPEGAQTTEVAEQQSEASETTEAAEEQPEESETTEAAPPAP